MRLADLEAGTTTGSLLQRRTEQMAAQQGHNLADWSPYGSNSLSSRCSQCGAEARIPYSVARGGYRRPEGPAVNPMLGTCKHQAQKHPKRKRGEENPMAKKPMKTPGAPGAGMATTSKRSFGRQTMGASATTMPPVDDASARDIANASLRAKPGSGKGGGIGGEGSATHRSRTATNASAQFRVSVSHRAPQPETAPGTTANGRLLPSVMGSKQSFAAGQRSGA